MKKHGSKALLTILTLGICSLFLPSVSALDPPCLSYSYTTDSNHYFLLEDNATLYGTTLIIKHNCNDLQVLLNDDLIHQTSTNSTLLIPEGVNNYTFILDNATFNYNNVNVINADLGWYDDYLTYLDNVPSLSQNDSKRQTNIVSFFSGVIIWALSVNVYWRLINHYIDRNYFEEVM
jgi:hypothetical protein